MSTASLAEASQVSDPNRVSAVAVEKAGQGDTIDLLGPFATIIRFSGLDGSALQKGRMCSVRSIFSLFFIFLITASILVRGVMLLAKDVVPLGLAWAEFNLFGFISAQALVSAVCVVSWSRSGFIEKFEENLCRVRAMRVAVSQLSTDDYKKLHHAAGILSLPLFVIAVASSIYHVLVFELHGGQHNTAYNSSDMYETKLLFMEPLIDFFCALATSLAAVQYVIVNVALNREVEHFNKELSNAARFQQLTLPQVLNAYNKRHAEIIQLVKFANGFLHKFSAIIPFFAFTNLNNCIFLSGGYKDDLPVVYMVLVTGWLFVSIAIVAVCLVSPSNVQLNIAHTCEILINDEVLQSCGDEQMHHTYRVMLDRCVHTHSKLMVFGAFAITHANSGVAYFLCPNVATILLICKKLDVYKFST